MYDESHIGNPEYSYDYICPNCGYDGSDKDGYCVSCGEYVRPERPKRRSKQKTTIPPLVKRILIVVGAGAAAFLMFFWGFCVGFDRRDEEYAAISEFAEGQSLTHSSNEDKQMLQDLVDEYKVAGLLELEMQSLLIRFTEKYYSSITIGDSVANDTQQMQKDLLESHTAYTDALDQILQKALDDNFVLDDKNADRTDFFLGQLRGVRGVWTDMLSKHDIGFMSLLGN